MRRLASVLLVLVVGAATAQADAPVLQAWLKAHGAPDAALEDLQDESCAAVLVGPHREAALQCDAWRSEARVIPGEDVPANQEVDHYSLRVVRDRKVVTLIDVPIRSMSEDAQPPLLRGDHQKAAPPWTPFVIAKDGMSIVVGDPKEAAACKTQLAAPPPTGATTQERTWAELRYDIDGGICRARGRYVWTNGVFIRKP